MLKRFSDLRETYNKWIDHEIDPPADKIWSMLQRSTKEGVVRLILNDNKLYVWDAYFATHDQFKNSMLKDDFKSFNYHEGLLSIRKPNTRGSIPMLDLPDRMVEKSNILQQFTKKYQDIIFD